MRAEEKKKKCVPAGHRIEEMEEIGTLRGSSGVHRIQERGTSTRKPRDWRLGVPHLLSELHLNSTQTRGIRRGPKKNDPSTGMPQVG